MAATAAWPLESMVARLPLKTAEAPVGGAEKVTWPPATGSPKGLVTRTTRGAEKAEPAESPLVVAPDDGEGEATGLEGADVGGAALGPGDAALVGRDASDGSSGVDGRAAGEQGLGEGGSAVVGQRAEERVGVSQVGGIEGHAGRVGEEVVAQRDERGARLADEVAAHGVGEEARGDRHPPLSSKEDTRRRCYWPNCR